MRTTLSISAKKHSKLNSKTALTPTSVSEPFLYLFGVKNAIFLQVFVPRVLIFKKLHLLLHSKMEVQGKKCVENH